MQNIVSPDWQRQLGNVFYLHIPVQGREEEEIRQLVRESMHVEQATKLMLSGLIDIEELLEYVEPVVPNMDKYVQEVEDSLLDILVFSNSPILWE